LNRSEKANYRRTCQKCQLELYEGQKRALPNDDLVRKFEVKHTTVTKIESDVAVKSSVQTLAKVANLSSVPMEDLVE